MLIKACWECTGPRYVSPSASPFRDSAQASPLSLSARRRRFRQAFATLFPNQTCSKRTRALSRISCLAATCVAGPTGWLGLSPVAERLSHPPTFASLRKKCIRIRLANVPRDAISKDPRRPFFFPSSLYFAGFPWATEKRKGAKRAPRLSGTPLFSVNRAVE